MHVEERVCILYVYGSEQPKLDRLGPGEWKTISEKQRSELEYGAKEVNSVTPFVFPHMHALACYLQRHVNIE